MECDRHCETQTIPSQAAIANELSMFGGRNSLENSEGGFRMKNQPQPSQRRGRNSCGIINWEKWIYSEWNENGTKVCLFGSVGNLRVKTQCIS